MKYINIETRAVFDSSFNIRGKNWVKLSDEKAEEPENEYVEEEVNLEEMTNQQLDDFAKEHKIELSSDDKKNKTTRINAIAKAFE